MGAVAEDMGNAEEPEATVTKKKKRKGEDKMATYTQEEYRKIREVGKKTLAEFIRICDKHNLKYYVGFGTAIGAVRHQGFIPWDDDLDVFMLRKEYDRFVEIAKTEMDSNYEIYGAAIQKQVQGFYLQMFPKGSKFLTRRGVRWPLCPGLKLDIFPYDEMPLAKEDREKIYKKTRFWNQLYIIRNTKYPILDEQGLKGAVMKAACICAYYTMKVFGPSLDKIVNKYVSLSKSCKTDTGYYVLVDDLNPDHWHVKKEELEPSQEVEFEGLKIKVPFKNHEILMRQYGDYMTPPPQEEQVGHDVGKLEFPKE